MIAHTFSGRGGGNFDALIKENRNWAWKGTWSLKPNEKDNYRKLVLRSFVLEVEKDDDGTQDNGEGDEVVDEEDIDEGAEVEEVAKAMRSSSHLWFKVASKYAEQAIAEVRLDLLIDLSE